MRAIASRPTVQAAQVDEDFPSPGGECESQQGDEPVIIRYLSKDTMGGAGGEEFVRAEPEADGAAEGQDEAHGLEIEGREEVAADEVGEAGGHAAGGAGDAGGVEEIAGFEVEEGQAGVGADAGGIGGEVGGEEEEGEAAEGDAEGEEAAGEGKARLGEAGGVDNRCGRQHDSSL